MSIIKISRVVENIRSGVNVYTPLIEMIVNAIQSIEYTNSNHGKIVIVVNRSSQESFGETLADITGFTIIDNGIGFTKEHRDSFDTLYSDYKANKGCKGFGRFICLKYFENLFIESIYQDEKGDYRKRTFSMGKAENIIENEKDEKIEISEISSISTTVELSAFKGKSSFADKTLSTIARRLIDKLLPYLVSDSYPCPKITLRDDSESIVLNNYLAKDDAQIKELTNINGYFSLKDENFKVRVFKFYYPQNQKSKISLVAHNREVTEIPIHTYIPEFSDEFYEQNTGKNQNENFIIKVYIFGDYLDRNVSLERGDFEFQKENDVLYGISQKEIESEAAKFAKDAVASDVDSRKKKKYEQVQQYVQNEAPWHSNILKDADLSDLPYNPTNEQIEAKLNKAKFAKETRERTQAQALLESGNSKQLKEQAAEIVKNISESSKDELTHYVALRRTVIEIFGKSLETDEDGQYSSEGIVHDIIFPRKGDSIKTPFEEHNLWLIDERLNFMSYLSSDIPLDESRDGRPDLIAYGRPVVFRGENEPSSPITIFEFKKPQRDDFVNPSSKEDPVQQMVRYVRKIKDGKFKTPKGRDIQVHDNTPFYGYIVCDLTNKVREYLELDKDFKPMSDNLGYFDWHEKLNIYIEVLSWDKVLKDATIRNKIFFHKLGI